MTRTAKHSYYVVDVQAYNIRKYLEQNNEISYSYITDMPCDLQCTLHIGCSPYVICLKDLGCSSSISSIY
jgi:hypothetical protein